MLQNIFFAAGLLFCSCGLFSEQLDQITQVQTQLPVVYSDITPAYQTIPEFSNAAVSVINREQFHSNDVSVADVLELSPGVQLQQTGEVGAYTNLSIRGAPSQQTQIFIDGILQSNSAGQGNRLHAIPLADVERIEVYKSSSPGQLALGGLGGAVNIVRTSKQQNEGSILLETGSYDHYRVSTSLNRLINQYRVSGFISHQNSANRFRYTNDGGTPLYSDDDTQDYRNNAEFVSTSASVSTVRQGSNGDAGLVVSYYQDTKQLPDNHNSIENDAHYAQTKLHSVASLNANQWLTNVDSSLRLSLSKDAGFFYDTNSAISLFPTESEDELTSTQLSQNSVIGAPFGLLMISNIASIDQFIVDDSRRGQAVNASRRHLANSIGVEVFWSDRLSLMSNIHMLTVVDSNNGLRNAMDHLGGNIGSRFGSDSKSIQLNLQYAYRVPTLIERFGSQGVFVGNDELEDEVGTSADITVDLKWSWLSVNAAVFARNSDNSIAPVYNAQGIGRFINLGSATFYGIEWQLATQYQRWGFDAQGAALYSRAYSKFKAYDDKQVPGSYPISGKAAVNYQFSDQWQSQVEYSHESGLYFDRANSTMAPDKHQLNAEFQWHRGRSKATFRIENILDRAHLDFSRKPLPGRTFSLTYQYAFGDNT